MKVKIILFILIGIIVSSCKKENSSIGIPNHLEINSENPDFKDFKKDNYSIKVHKNWIIEPNTPDGVDLYIYMDTQDDFVENINLIIHDLGTNKIDLSDIEQSAKADFLKIDGSIISSEKITNPNSEFQRIVAKAPYLGENLKYILHYQIKDNKLYSLTFTSLEREFNQYEKIAEQIMQSFTIN